MVPHTEVCAAIFTASKSISRDNTLGSVAHKTDVRLEIFLKVTSHIEKLVLGRFKNHSENRGRWSHFEDEMIASSKTRSFIDSFFDRKPEITFEYQNKGLILFGWLQIEDSELDEFAKQFSFDDWKKQLEVKLSNFSMHPSEVISYSLIEESQYLVYCRGYQDFNDWSIPFNFSKLGFTRLTGFENQNIEVDRFVSFEMNEFFDACFMIAPNVFELKFKTPQGISPHLMKIVEFRNSTIRKSMQLDKNKHIHVKLFQAGIKNFAVEESYLNLFQHTRVINQHSKTFPLKKQFANGISESEYLPLAETCTDAYSEGFCSEESNLFGRLYELAGFKKHAFWNYFLAYRLNRHQPHVVDNLNRLLSQVDGVTIQIP